MTPTQRADQIIESTSKRFVEEYQRSFVDSFDELLDTFKAALKAEIVKALRDTQTHHTEEDR